MFSNPAAHDVSMDEEQRYQDHDITDELPCDVTDELPCEVTDVVPCDADIVPSNDDTPVNIDTPANDDTPRDDMPVNIDTPADVDTRCDTPVNIDTPAEVDTCCDTPSNVETPCDAAVVIANINTPVDSGSSSDERASPNPTDDTTHQNVFVNDSADTTDNTTHQNVLPVDDSSSSDDDSADTTDGTTHENVFVNAHKDSDSSSDESASPKHTKDTTHQNVLPVDSDSSSDESASPNRSASPNGNANPTPIEDNTHENVFVNAHRVSFSVDETVKDDDFVHVSRDVELDDSEEVDKSGSDESSDSDSNKSDQSSEYVVENQSNGTMEIESPEKHIDGGQDLELQNQLDTITEDPDQSNVNNNDLNISSVTEDPSLSLKMEDLNEVNAQSESIIDDSILSPVRPSVHNDTYVINNDQSQ